MCRQHSRSDHKGPGGFPGSVFVRRVRVVLADGEGMDAASSAALAVALFGGLVTLVNMWLTERVRTANQTAIEEVKAAYQHGIEEAKAEYQRDLERLRSELNALSFEHQTRFVRLHERRVDVIAEMYRLLAIAEVAFQPAIAPARWGENAAQEKILEDRREAATAGNAFEDFFRVNRLWLDDDLSSSLDNLAQHFRKACFLYDNKDRRPDPEEAWESAWRQVTEDVPKTRAEIEAAMREMLAGPSSTDVTAP